MERGQNNERRLRNLLYSGLACGGTIVSLNSLVCALRVQTGFTALHTAASRGNIAALKALLAAGANKEAITTRQAPETRTSARPQLQRADKGGWQAPRISLLPI